jgi:hypothetical protein
MLAVATNRRNLDLSFANSGSGTRSCDAMPSFDHEILVDLFRENGELAVELLRTPAGIAVDHARVVLDSIDLSQVAPTVAAWARQPIELGHPGFRLRPIVIGFDEVPWVRDRDAALRLPELAMLSVMGADLLRRRIVA